MDGRGAMMSSLQIKERIANMDVQHAQAGEIVVYHSVRESLVSITATSVQEMDVRTGVLLGEITMDAHLVGEKPNAFEYAVACGHKYIVASHARFLVVWDLKDMILLHVAEIASAKHISALAASTCVKGTLFYAHDGSQSIKATTVDALCAADPTTGPKKVPRKVASRSSTISVLAYHTATAVLACGASDGMVHVWRCGESDVTTDETKGAPPDGEFGHSLLATVTSKAAAVVALVLDPSTTCAVVDLAVAYASKHIEVYTVESSSSANHDNAVAAKTTPTATPVVPTGFSFRKPASLFFAPLPHTLVVLLEDDVDGAVVANVLSYAPDNDARFRTPLDLALPRGGVAHFAVTPRLALYTSTTTARGLSAVEFGDDDVFDDVTTTTMLQWSTTAPLSFGQYCNPDHVPDALVQLAWVEETRRFDVVKLSLRTSDRTSLGGVPTVWDHQPVTPRRVLATGDWSAWAVLLTTPSATTALALSTASSSVVYEVADACFTAAASLVTLNASGKSLRQHLSLTTSEPQGTLLTLPTPASRIFCTRMPLPHSDVCKLVFVVRDAMQDTLRLSETTLAFAAESTVAWTSHKHERVLDVQMEPSTQAAQPHGMAVLTTHRVVVLDASLVAVASYAPPNRLLLAPTSILWLGSTLAFTTTGGGLFYLPTQHPQQSTPTLLCSLATTTHGTHIQLAACLHDRLVYSVVREQPSTADGPPFLATTLTRPCSILEVFVRSQPDADLTRLFVHREIEYAPIVPVSHGLVELLRADPEMTLAVLASTASGSSGSFRATSHLATSVVCALYLALHRWPDALFHALADDPPLQARDEYARDATGSGAQLPQKLSVLSSQLSHVGRILEKYGQFNTAAQCYDVAGNDRALLELVLKCADTDALQPFLDAFRSTNGPLHAALTAGRPTDTPPKRDAFRLLCSEHLVFERRSRLLSQSSLKNATLKSGPSTAAAPLPTTTTWKYFTWKRVVPDDAAEWVGSATPHYATEEFQVKKKAALLSVDTRGSGSFDESSAVKASHAPSIGPFLDEEDGVVAYWRFEDGATNGEVGVPGVQLVDTSKRENHITITQLSLVLSTAPVDRGEDAKLQPEYAMRFPDVASSDAGGKVTVKKGSTLDIGVGFDEDPYRRCLTVECWARRTNDEPTSGTLFRRETPSSLVLWSFGIDRGALSFTLLGMTVKSDATAFKTTDTWQHVAAVVDIVSDEKAAIRLAVDGVHVLTKDVSMKLALQDHGDVSTLFVGPLLTGMEVTEIRLWATARSEQQLADMKENYLSMAESKKRIKMKIHERDCQCEKCLGRRQNTPVAKLAMVQPLALTPSSRDRRQRMKAPQTPSPMNKSEETRT
ncbi:Aste57867_2970 [Aphanomyces stellatus]|uniref:Aste57867_2970 protein n=1 Tax=Aphanomyces stellatus TaxID=120398 RepID=A0A485K9S0_9STRA|nr:hypothetical protein As57867_002961 [Aphanomyces stellatus]VFT80152.1 Aste57867_2970 [Aphanomyces stellatus]